MAPRGVRDGRRPLSRRGAAIDEVAAAMRACWGPDPVVHHGDLYRIPPSEVNPKPVQPHIPILYATGTAAGVRRAARRADGVFLGGTEDRVRSELQVFADAAREAGREPADLRVVVIATVPITSRPVGSGRPFLGESPQQIAQDLQLLQDLGVDDVAFRNAAPDGLDREIELLEAVHAAAQP